MNAKITVIDTIPTVDPYHLDTNTPTKTCLNIDPANMVVKVYQEYDDNATPADVWHGLVISERIDGHPFEIDVRGVLESQTGKELLERISVGYETFWDGSNQRGRLSDDAQGALSELTKELNELSDADTGYQCWAVADWFSQTSDDLREWLATTPTNELTDTLTREARAENVVLLGDVEEYLDNLKE